MPSRSFESDLTSKEKVGLVSGERSQHLSISWNLQGYSGMIVKQKMQASANFCMNTHAYASNCCYASSLMDHNAYVKIVNT